MQQSGHIRTSASIGFMLAMVLAAHACRASRPAAVAGRCYQFDAPLFVTLAYDSGTAQAVVSRTAVVALRGSALADDPDRHPVRALGLRITDDTVRQDRFSYWRYRSPTDSSEIELVWSDGFSGMAMHLRAERGGLRGRMRYRSDVAPDPTTWLPHRVRARLVPCPTDRPDTGRAHDARQ